MERTLRLNTDGDVWLDADGIVTLVGPITDDYRCPAGMESAWAALTDQWLEETAEGRAELAGLKAEYYISIGATR